jgi:hypothetical protein
MLALFLAETQRIQGALRTELSDTGHHALTEKSNPVPGQWLMLVRGPQPAWAMARCGFALFLFQSRLHARDTDRLVRPVRPIPSCAGCRRWQRRRELQGCAHTGLPFVFSLMARINSPHATGSREWLQSFCHGRASTCSGLR